MNGTIPSRITDEMLQLATAVRHLAHIVEALTREARWHRQRPEPGMVQVEMVLDDANAWSWAVDELDRRAQSLHLLLEGRGS